MDAIGSNSEYVAALAPEREPASTSSSATVWAIEDHIEPSKSHWSQLTELDSNLIEKEEAAETDNQEVFMPLQRHPTCRHFFCVFGHDTEEWLASGELEEGERFAEAGRPSSTMPRSSGGAQRLTRGIWRMELSGCWKVFKKGTLLRRLQVQWPHGLFQWHAKREELSKLGLRFRCATLLEDGRIAFVMEREHQDLRSLIDCKILGFGVRCLPFQNQSEAEIMYRVARAMDWRHCHNIVHTDLKASNVLFSEDERGWRCYVADHEGSIGAVGTGFWRAPEILQACKGENVYQRPELFTNAADAYSYGMARYEILTEKLPFPDEYVTLDLVIQELRHNVSEFVDESAHELLRWCWQFDPSERPLFEKILIVLEANSNSRRIRRRTAERMKNRSCASRSFLGLIENLYLKLIKLLRGKRGTRSRWHIEIVPNLCPAAYLNTFKPEIPINSWGDSDVYSRYD